MHSDIEELGGKIDNCVVGWGAAGIGVLSGGVWIVGACGATSSGSKSIKFKLSPVKDILLLLLIKDVIVGIAS